MIDEGYIKYEIEWERGPAVTEDVQELLDVRDELWQKKLIGEYEELGIGYGNVSQRAQLPEQFIVSGTQTGNIAQLQPEHMAQVLDWDLERNWLKCTGPVKASSESLTHAAIYHADPEIKVILHIHNLPAWHKLLKSHPFTRESIPYGTPEMALEVHRLFRESELKSTKVFAMAGHDEGIFSFGTSAEEAKTTLFQAIFQ